MPAKVKTIMSERRSSNAIEDPNVLALRSRTIDVALRHSDKSSRSDDHDEQVIPRKRQRTEAKQGAVVDDLESKPTTEKTVLTVLGPKDNTNGETALSSGDSGVPSSVSLPEGPAPEDTEASKQQEITLELSAHQSPPEVVKASHRAHKHFQSEEPEADTGKESDPAIPTVGDDITTVQSGTQGVPNDVSDDEDAPETFSTNVKQALPFPSIERQLKFKKRRPRNSAPEDVRPQESRSAVTPLVSNVGGADNNQLSTPEAKALTASKRPRNIDAPATKKVKDFVKDGVTYRSVSGEGLRGHTSPWLPAKASTESMTCKERLLVRKRVQKVNIGQRQKFVVS